MREALRLEEALDLNRPGHADAREVVAAEVDEHHVLGAVLLRGEQPLGVALARVRRAGDRVQARAPALDLDERLRRRADEREVVELEQEEVRRRVDAPQRAVELRAPRPSSAAPRAGRGRSGRHRRRGCGALPPRRARSYSKRPGRAPRAPAAPPFRPASAGSGPSSPPSFARSRPRRRRAPRRARCTWSKRTSTSATTKRLSGRSPARLRQLDGRLELSRRSRSRGSRRPARRRSRPPRCRRAASRSRRTSAARGARARRTRAGTRRRRRRAQPEVRPERGDEIGCDDGYRFMTDSFRATKKTSRLGRSSSGTGCGLNQIRRCSRPARGARYQAQLCAGRESLPPG